MSINHSERWIGSLCSRPWSICSGYDFVFKGHDCTVRVVYKVLYAIIVYTVIWFFGSYRVLEGDPVQILQMSLGKVICACLLGWAT